MPNLQNTGLFIGNRIIHDSHKLRIHGPKLGRFRNLMPASVVKTKKQVFSNDPEVAECFMGIIIAP